MVDIKKLILCRSIFIFNFTVVFPLLDLFLKLFKNCLKCIFFKFLSLQQAVHFFLCIEIHIISFFDSSCKDLVFIVEVFLPFYFEIHISLKSAAGMYFLHKHGILKQTEVSVLASLGSIFLLLQRDYKMCYGLVPLFSKSH